MSSKKKKGIKIISSIVGTIVCAYCLWIIPGKLAEKTLGDVFDKKEKKDGIY